jgi:hypothetical protein
MSRKTEKVVCGASSHDFIFANFAGKSFSTPTPDFDNYQRTAETWKFYATRSSYWSLAYSALASLRIGRSGSASFHRAKKSW